jgi:hypothetical protein
MLADATTGGAASHFFVIMKRPKQGQSKGERPAFLFEAVAKGV